MRRRDVLAAIGAAAAWPLTARAQQKAMPVIGFLGSALSGPYAPYVAAFRQGLSETGYVEGEDFAIEYRWAEGKYERLPALAADLVSRKVALIAASGGNVSALAAKNATSTIPIVFFTGGDPVGEGPGGEPRAAGRQCHRRDIHVRRADPKRLELLAELVPKAGVIALLTNPNSPGTERMTQEVQEAAGAKGMQLPVLKASTGSRDRGRLFFSDATTGRRAAGRRRPILLQSARAALVVGSASCSSDYVSVSRVRRLRRIDRLWIERHGGLSPCRRLCRKNSEGRETG